MAQRVLITGASSGIGKAAASLFHEHGWNVAATMRNPENAGADFAQKGMIVPKLDVTQPETIASAVDETISAFGGIDVLVNNAGYALVGPFETMTPEQLERQFATNVLGLMNVTRAVLPHFRAQGAGTVINVSSVAGRVAFPFMSVYHGSKWAVEGFSESLQYELRRFNIRVKVVEPGPVKTDFYDRSLDVGADPSVTAYDALFKASEAGLRNTVDRMGALPEVTARVICRAATDRSWRLRYPAGGGAAPILWLRRLIPERLFQTIVRMAA